MAGIAPLAVAAKGWRLSPAQGSYPQARPLPQKRRGLASIIPSPIVIG
jgi:hypothetical protein